MLYGTPQNVCAKEGLLLKALLYSQERNSFKFSHEEHAKTKHWAA